MSTCNQLGLESLGSWPTMTKNFPGTACKCPWWAEYKGQPVMNLLGSLWVSKHPMRRPRLIAPARQISVPAIHRWNIMFTSKFPRATSHTRLTMIRENRQLLTSEPVEVRDYMRITDHFIGIYGIYSIFIKENRRMWTCNRLDLQTLGSQPVIMPKNLPDHCRLKQCSGRTGG